MLNRCGRCFHAFDSLSDSDSELPYVEAEDCALNPLVMSPNKQNHALSSTQYQIDRLHRLGKGAYAIVYEGAYHNQPVAIKVLISNQSENIACAQRENIIYELIAHSPIAPIGADCLLRYYGYDPMTCTLITEQANAGSVDQLIFRCQPLTAQATFVIMQDIVKGLCALHHYSIIHCDLKPANVLLVRDNVEHTILHAKIMDFGLSQYKLAKRAEYAGSAYYLAPEVLRRRKQGKKSDIYSLGITLWEIQARSVVDSEYQVNTLKELIPCVVDNNKRPSIKETFPKKIADLMTRCWVFNPKERPSAEACNTIMSKVTLDDLQDTCKNDSNAR